LNSVQQMRGNRFDLIIMASARAREIKRLNANSNRFEHVHTALTALKEFESGKLGPEYIKRIK